MIVLVSWFFFATQYYNNAPLTSTVVGPFDSEAACQTLAGFYQTGAVDFFNPEMSWVISDCYSSAGVIYSPNLYQSK